MGRREEKAKPRKAFRRPECQLLRRSTVPRGVYRLAPAMMGRNTMRIPAFFASFAAVLAISVAADAFAPPAASPTRTMKIISSAGARGLVEGCTAWAEKNK